MSHVCALSHMRAHLIGCALKRGRVNWVKVKFQWTSSAMPKHQIQVLSIGNNGFVGVYHGVSSAGGVRWLSCHFILPLLSQQQFIHVWSSHFNCPPFLSLFFTHITVLFCFVLFHFVHPNLLPGPVFSVVSLSSSFCNHCTVDANKWSYSRYLLQERSSFLPSKHFIVSMVAKK